MKERAKKLETSPYKGVRDFYPDDMWVQAYIFEIWSIVAESFGYERYDASVLEPSELFKVKSGDEIVSEQTYTFIDKGDREVSLRPEMTPSVARMVSAKRRELAFPLRWYSIPNLFRYERPQRGRLREHWQLNCDIFGVEDTAADVEIMLLADAVMRGFGAERSLYTIHVNHMGALIEAFAALDIEENKHTPIRKLLDQKNKRATFEADFEELAGISYGAFEETVAKTAAAKTLRDVITELASYGVLNVVVDPAIVRGQEYYTGIVFEVFDVASENNRAMFGGGRYDELMDLFGAEETPAVGFGMGDVTIRDFLLTHDLLPERPAKTDLFIATFDVSYIPHAQKLAERLREGGINVSVNLTKKKVGDQLGLADRQGIPYALVLGEDELKSGTYTVKDLSTGKSETLTDEDIAHHISDPKT